MKKASRIKLLRLLDRRRITKVFLTVSDKFFVLLGGFVVLQLLAERVSKAEFGTYSLGISIFVIISMLPFTAVDHAVNRYWSIYDEQSRWPEAVSAIARLYALMTVLYGLLALVFILFPLPVPGELKSGFFAVFTFSLVEVYRITLLNIENAQRKRAVNTFSNGFIYIARCVAILVLNNKGLLNISNIFWSFSLLSVMNVGYLVVVNLGDYTEFLRSSWKQSVEICQQLLRFARPMIIWGPFIWAQNMMNRWLLGLLHDETTVAEFVSVNAVATLFPTAAFGVIWALMTPILYKKENEKEGATRALNRWIMPSFGVILVIGFLVCWLFADSIFSVVFTKYSSGAWMLPLLYIPAAFIQWAAYGSSELYAGLNTSKLLVANVIPGLSSFVLGLPLIYYLEPLTGATLNSIITGLIYFFLMMRIVRRHRSVALCP